ncbi:MAG: 16S rRNA (cytosine(1402)-N(4))-methyltransferase RsmH [Flavobacteriaceae bacterium]|nr:16S rRNA (cytosine(1402)-N(4))-methyltransferase RsmH [Flavobacteriaceae bacterium]
MENNPATTTPTGYHIPVLLQESVDGLDVKPAGIYVDLTYGGGGHSKLILERLGTEGRIIAFDRDIDAINNIQEDERLTLVGHNFRFMKQFLEFMKIAEVDGVLADLGVSSHQFDEGGRGFSYRFEADLDMRMDIDSELSAVVVLNNYSEEKLAEIFKNYGELYQARKMARLVCEYRKSKQIKTTSHLQEAIRPATPLHDEYQTWSKVFQALRIEVNGELEVLKLMLPQAESMMKKGGRLAVISFHSLEDRIVKNYIQKGNVEGEEVKDFYGNKQGGLKQARKMIVPTDEEISLNPRARSAKLRIAEKI